MELRVYMFYINGENADSPIFSCVAHSESEAEDLARRAGYSDFFLASVRELEEHETPDFIDNSIRVNPFVGQEWEPVIRAICWAIENSDIGVPSPHWCIQTYGERYHLSPNRSPYVQGMRQPDGSLYVELSGNIICDPPLDEKQIQHLVWIGWTSPEDSANDGPNFLRIFEPGWTPRLVAERIIETWTSVMNITAADYFRFSPSKRESDEIERLGGLERMPTHDNNPDGVIFRLISDENDRLAARTFEFARYIDNTGDRWLEIAPRIFCQQSEFDAFNYSEVKHFGELTDLFSGDEILEIHRDSARYVVERSERQMRDVWNAALDEIVRANDYSEFEVDMFACTPPRITLENSTRSHTAQAHRIAFALLSYSRCRVGFLLLDRAENIARLAAALSDRRGISSREAGIVSAAAWLSAITQPTPLEGYNRHLDALDLKSWGIAEEVIDVLAAVNPSRFEIRREWFQSLEANPNAQILAIAVELDRIVLSEFDASAIPNNLRDLGKQSSDFTPPAGITNTLRVAQVLDGLSNDAVTRDWIDETLAAPRAFWNNPEGYRWKSWNEFIARTYVHCENLDKYELGLPQDPLIWPFPHLFTDPDRLRDFDAQNDGERWMSIAIVCGFALDLIESDERAKAESHSSNVDAHRDVPEVKRQLNFLKARAIANADRCGYLFIENENCDNTEQIARWLVRAGHFGLSLFAQKWDTYAINSDDAATSLFSRNDLLSVIDDDVSFATSILIYVLGTWDSDHQFAGRHTIGLTEQLHQQIRARGEWSMKSFASRSYEFGLHPSKAWLKAHIAEVPEVAKLLNELVAGQESVVADEGCEPPFGPQVISDEFLAYVYALARRHLTDSSTDRELIDKAMETPNIRLAIRLSVFAVCHSVVNDHRPCVISISSLSPGRIEQTVDVHASMKQGTLSITLTFRGESISLAGETSWLIATEEDPLSPPREIQMLSVSLEESVPWFDSGSNSLFHGVHDLLDELDSAIDAAHREWRTREVQSIVLWQDKGGFVEPVLRYFGRHCGRGVFVTELPDAGDAFTGV